MPESHPTSASSSAPTPASRAPRDLRVGVNDVVRFVLELFAFFTFGFWGFVAWPLPWNIVLGIVTPLFAILVWALFRSPKAVFHIDAFGKALVEIVVMGAAAFAWLMLGQPIIALVFGVVAVVSGVIAGRKELA
ncbi:YrdB family protein [Herbiconiux moechotypicola]|uniref:YrdB family protein n=1 Tax=Herbiconiux moechotypicola TaxID=637393 RepID=UPI00217D7285|nr:YrdB family protein [Herbiconiux moechotypicola]MCS5730637.1 YrdB family protein [Herbiconiux moechotypicola]